MKKDFIPAETQKKEIPIRDRAGKTLVLKNKGCATQKGKPKNIKIPFEIGNVVWGQQSDTTESDPKIIIIQEILWKDGSERKELRFGYFVLTSEKSTHKGVWWWGQSALMVPVGDIQELLKLAEEKGLLTI
jgi:hypothetical protein